MAFNRPAAFFKNKLGSDEFPYEDGRYILYVTMGCPWATGTLAVTKLRKVDKKMKAICILHPTWQYTDREKDLARIRSPEFKAGTTNSGGYGPGEPHAGWTFADKDTPVVPLGVGKHIAAETFGLDEEAFLAELSKDTARAKEWKKTYGVLASDHVTLDASGHAAKSLRELYGMSGGDALAGVRPTTPMLWCTKTSRVVAHESTEIIKMLCAWPPSAGETPGPDVLPKALEDDIAKMNDWIYAINNGVYRCGFARDPQAYAEASQLLLNRMVEVEAYLAGKEYLLGNQLTVCDIRLYNTMVRMDEVYVTYFKTGFAGLLNNREKFPNLLQHTARMYQTFPEIRAATSMHDIRHHYFTSHPNFNRFAIVPREVGFLSVLEGVSFQPDAKRARVS